MQHTYTLRQVSTALRLTRVRVVQWIARRQFRIDEAPSVGVARTWGIDDAIRLAIFAALVESGVPPVDAGVATQHPFRRHGEFLVVWKGKRRGHWGRWRDSLQAHDLVPFLEKTDVDFASAVLNVDNVQQRVRRALGHPE
jgi:hypothetical protein